MVRLEIRFTGNIEKVRERGAPEVFEAEITYRILPNHEGMPQFTEIRREGETIPLHTIAESSLIRAYAKHRGIGI